MSSRPELRNVEVRVRVRPGAKKSAVRTHSTKELSVDDKRWAFDRVYGPDSQQSDVYEEAVKPLVEATLDGYNSTVFAYGQTGSGKTYTMGTGHETLSKNEGVVPRALRDLFDTGSAVKIRGSYVEVYNEELRDLLDPAPKKLHIREDATRGIFVDGARQVSLTSVEDAVTLLERGAASRATEATRLNDRSSRSHAILTLTVERRKHLVEDSNGDVRASSHIAVVRSKIHCVDLAGSERCKRSGAQGARLKEGIHINGGLLALGKVISALCDREEGKSAHAPYRESKLTRLLQDSLGGTARTCMLACVSPDGRDLPETLTTLGYASRARRVKNTVQQNATTVVVQGPSHLELENRRLRAQLAAMSVDKPPPPPSPRDDFGDGPHRLQQAVCEGNRRLAHVKVALESIIAKGGLDLRTRDAIRAIVESVGGKDGDPPLGELVTGGPVRAVLELQAAVDQRDAKLRCLEGQLREARSDLQRDEEIFATRARELRDCKDQLRRKDREVSDLRAHLVRAEARADATEQVLKSAKSRLSTDNAENEDPLDLTSKLRASCLRAESKAKRDLDREQESLKQREQAQKRLQVLEQEISTKEACIASLAASEREATKAVSQYQKRITLLEREAEQLRSMQSPSTVREKKNELAQLKMQDIERVEQLRKASEVRICELHEEVTTLKSQRDSQRPTTSRPVTARTRDKLEKRAHRWLRRRLDAVTRPPTAGAASSGDPFDALRSDVAELPQKHCAAALTEALRQLVSHRINRVVTPPVPPSTIAAYEAKIDMLLRELHKYES
jgi:hypothetical protein